MIPTTDIVVNGTPAGWRTVPFWSLFRREKKTGFPDEELLSVYRDYGVIPKSSRDDNHNKESEDLSGYQLVNEGALVTNKMKAWQGSIAISRYRGIVSPAYYVYTPQSDECDQFLHYLLRSDPYIGLYGRISKGVRVNQWDLEHEALRNIPVLLPDFATQRQIADFLNRETARIDLLIEKKQRLLALLGERTAETIRQCVSWGMDSSVPKKPSRVPAADDLAAHWTEQRLSTICRFVQGKAHEPFIEDNGEYICVTARFVSTNGEKFRRCTKNLTPGKVNDIAMVMSDLPNGRALARAFLVDQNDLYAINQRVCAITVMEGDPRFFCYQLDRNFQLLRYNDGFNQTHLPNRSFTQLFLKVPPVEEQTSIANYLDAVTQHTTALTEKTEASIDRLKEYRSALITTAVTGQIDVSAHAKTGTTDRRLDAIQEELQAQWHVN